MTRIDSVRAATGSAKDSVLHAAEAVAPYADTARERAAAYAHEARVRLAPKVSLAADQARAQYGAYVAPRLEQARAQAMTYVPPKLDQAAQVAACRTRQAARRAAEYSRPRIEQARAVAGPVADEAAARGAAALVALRGQVRPEKIQKLARKHSRRCRAGRVAKLLAVAGVLAGGAFAAWRWWDKQANPDWLVEPPAATEVPEEGRLSAVDGSGQTPAEPGSGTQEATSAEERPTDRDDRA
ncbi:DUF5324 family protein [Streptomyces thermodiastaticus]|uniref:DUF5324 family protein n=1 Tax=Streptomyces thermodiastaticus TaxID=44061 RepID=UPI001672F28B|nr:DUF5324 family protein [Streptomyces thermodiastaticus]MCE7550441.1 DUF5324 family protein [Streptomyces thermodiastaticus]GHF69402.1 hypothetical protein GCM10018787_17310 [Streptomyces thermodiastaticus]